jgi:hypothetical protein
MRGTRGRDIDGFPLLRIVATKYLFRLDAKVFVINVALCGCCGHQTTPESGRFRDYSQGERLFNARSELGASRP